MVQLQILSKILESGNNSIVEENFLTVDYFVGYEKEFNFIQDHVQKYGNVPDKATFLSNFPDIEFVEVGESDRYLVDTIREEYLYQQSIPVLQRMSDLLKVDSNAAAEYMASQLNVLQPNYDLGGVDIVAQANARYEQFQERRNNPHKWCFETGFPELDDLIDGIQREEEVFVIYARTNMCKSWVLEKICAHIWGTGFNVGYFSPEMSANSIGFRFDTLTQHYANRALVTGGQDIDDEKYSQYITELQQKDHRFIVTTPADFGNATTVTKLKNWIRKFKLDVIAIDGITYLSDERGKKGDNKTTSLTNISEDLMSLSIEMKVPVIVVVQANRSGVVGDDDDTPELDSIRDSDGISHNASKAIALQQKKNNVLVIEVKKHRNGMRGGKLKYTCDINTGTFTFIPSMDDAESKERTRKKADEQTEKYKNKADVF